MPAPKKHLNDLYRLFAAVRTEKDAEILLEDILTPQELESLAERWQLVQALLDEVPQRTIAKRLGISISKITRGSRAIQFGSGGFRDFHNQLKKRR